ncbi:MAG: peptidase [Synechococcaceae cyanobacterium SM2_3_60]|nr:peptidase [Synechococcaceae cyanobacterium SM2_3_60]
MRLLLTTVALLGLGATAALAQYNPPALPAEGSVSGTLSTQDLPLGYGSFAKDYSIELEADTVIRATLRSGDFDTLLILIGPDGNTILENDDYEFGVSTNSQLFSPIDASGRYILRVSSYGSYYYDEYTEESTTPTFGGSFDLDVQLSRLTPL